MEIISADQLSTYVVCPEAWRLKYIEKRTEKRNERGQEGAEVKRKWVEKQDLSQQLKTYAKVAYLLLVLITIIAFLLDQKRLLNDLTSKKIIKLVDGSIPEEIVALLLILGLLIFMWDLFDRQSNRINRIQGFSDKSEILSVKGSDYLAPKEFFSEKLGLISKPDALIKEKRLIIPVDINPITTNLRDRHIIRMLVHLKLIEEVEGVRPPYGLIILGEEKIQHRIENESEKQVWLESLIEEIRSIENGVPAMPLPAKAKCKNCDVREFCKYKAS